MERVTIKDVAERVGVSKTAVSFAFNDPSRLPAATVEKILRAAQELGYTPHPLARSLSLGRTGVVGLLLPQDIPTILENSFFIQFTRGIGRVCDEQGLSLLLAPPVEGSMRRTVNEAIADGFVVLGLEAHDPIVNILRQRRLPFVAVDSEAPDDVASVSIDDYHGARAAMECILAHGHRRIAMVAFESGKEGRWQEYTGTLHWRLTGYLDALAVAGLRADSPGIHILETENSAEGGRDALQRLAQGAAAPTAIVAMSDTIALGVIAAARARGLAVPRDLSVIGYDDVPEAQRAEPALTTVYQPVVEKGEQAAELLVAILQGEPTCEHRTLPTQLILRGSVGPAPSL